MKTQIKSMKRNETGSIMLEVVAVLALMGVMGAMLFRQIYQRNQELHNIQMASEIRTVKEAFSAYIQANRASVLEQCPVPSCDATGCEVLRCSVSDLNAGVAGYLPDGWFTAEELDNAYKLTVWNYLQDDGSDRRVVYGIVVPKEATLPTTGWNFKRAARVALLVGADGGAYDTTITDGKIAGALGSWEIDATDTGIQDHSYAAMTGIDIFAPEYEAPEGAVGLPAEWDLALKNLHAYNYFAVGRKDGAEANCYTIQKDGEKRKYNLTENMVYSDSVTTNINNCQPLFWVGSDDGANGTSGNVYVQNDLNVGADMTGNGDHALSLTKEGVIKQKDGLIIDGAGRIISRDKVYGNGSSLGDLKDGEHYVLDPGRVSTMSDIRLASRGGVRLSDILPDYILKGIYNAASSSTSNYKDIPVPNCPTGYKKALSITGVSTVNQRGTSSSTSTTTLKYNGSTTLPKITVPAEGGDVDLSKLTATTTTSTTTTITEGACFYIEYNGEKKDNWHGYTELESDKTGNWRIYVANKNDNESCKTAAKTSTDESFAQPSYTVYTYCVWSPSLLNQNECGAAGYSWSGGKCTATHRTESNWDVNATGEVDTICTAYGFTWDSANKRCIFKYVDAADINNSSKVNKKFDIGGTNGSTTETDAEVLERRAAVCKAAGYKWNGTACSAS